MEVHIEYHTKVPDKEGLDFLLIGQDEREDQHNRFFFKMLVAILLQNL